MGNYTEEVHNEQAVCRLSYTQSARFLRLTRSRINTNAESKIALVVLPTFSVLKSDACPKKKRKRKKEEGHVEE